MAQMCQERWSSVTVFALTVFALGARVPAAAQSQGSDREPDSQSSASGSAEQGMFLPTLIAPGGDRASPGIAVAYGGYDGGTDAGVMKVSGDVKVIGPLDARLGLTYTPNLPNTEAQAQPHFGARLRLLAEHTQGIDLSTLLLYRMERFTDDEGLVQGVVALGKHWGRVGLFGNAAYGQDPEGDDREGELALAMLYRASAPLQLGLESHLRVDLFSDDPKRAVRNDSNLELTAGPVAHVSLGPIAVLAQVGVHAIELDRVRTGVIALGGIAYAH